MRFFKWERFSAILRHERFLLGILLTAFFLKGMFLATLYPIFGGQDEARHYSGIQFISEPADIRAATNKDLRPNDNRLWEKDDFNSYNFSEEIQRTAQVTDTSILRGDLFNTIGFVNGSNGKNEALIGSGLWKPYNHYAQPDIASAQSSFYHRLASFIERVFADRNILVRFYSIRILSVLLGMFAVFLAYHIARTVGFAGKHAVMLAAIIAFQPKFSSYFTNINYDVLLIPMFFLFTYAGTLILKRGPNWKNSGLLVLSMTVAILTKATGYILLAPALGLVAYLLYEKVKLCERQVRNRAYAAVALMAFAIVSFIYTHFLVSTRSLGQTIASIGEYLSRTITFGKFVMPSDTYWGTLSWTRSFAIDHTPDIILVIELAALLGLFLYMRVGNKVSRFPDFLPERKQVIFLAMMIVALELGIRVADWRVWSDSGSMRYGLGTPGRYFLPNLSAHVILIATGLGTLLHRFRKEQYFEPVLLSLLLLMFSLTTYLTFDAIILRFYF